ncbi:MAG: hypothetical protein ABIO36_09670 [Pyrinomonadaceae bacterium]
MNIVKCRKCGLVNVATDTRCRRCGEETGRQNLVKKAVRGPREAAKESSWLYTILFIGLLGAASTYLFKGVERSFDSVKTTDGIRIANQVKPQPEGLSSRSEQDQKRVEQYKNALANSPDLATSQKHNEDVKKLMQPDQGNSHK